MLRMRTLLCSMLLGLLWLPLAGCEPFVKGLVPDESGFEGAVTVEDMGTQDGCGWVTVKLPFQDVYGESKIGLARIVVPRVAMEPGRKLPAFCHVHYEKDIGGACKWAKEGWAVATAVYTGMDGEHPIDASPANGNNEARALIAWVRRLPFIDRTRLHIDGGSQGGYMALAMCADMFPVTSGTPDVPVVNWAYNLNYFVQNKEEMRMPGDPQASPMPVMASVFMLADWCFRYYTDDLSDDTWYRLSPISYLDRIANPMLVTCATGDMLVPIEQMSRTAVRPFDPARFPEGYTRDFDSLAPSEPTRRVFEEAVPPEMVSIHLLPAQEHSYEITSEMMRDASKRPKLKPKNQDKPWSKDHQWSLLYLDEGPPAPQAGHTTREWSLSPDSFVAHYQTAAPGPEILNAAKLDRLMQRYLGQLQDLPRLKDGRPVNRLNAAYIEQRDVLTGLLDYAGMGAAHEARLDALYAAGSSRPFGDTLDLDVLRWKLEELTGAPAA